MGATAIAFSETLYPRFAWAISPIVALIILATIGRPRLAGLYRAANKSWLAWEVLVPIGVPIVMTMVIDLMQQTGPHPPPFSLEVLVDLTPWTLTFFSLTLIAHSLRRLWPHIEAQKVPFVAIIGVAFVVALYAGFIVQWRHETWKPDLRVYSVAAILTLVSVWFCHASADVGPE